uniref:Pseudouridine synthase RsuA/RluA-like domain-containing protein n=1 Tax=Mucochytrium quahogii TaxID=96639 RepID=A0A7S2RGX6_9STRA|mmetsp:Transcript_2688/g.3849  ORF Transcript_2688/g.3849 Transcript_2688/m.3849 type:complete len:414 (-) Transcript_2688:1917-3158(-)|eukprot:CAMPEP_0203763038 /NCGR_PEP_ID=MMETSP0098-20131031/15756_1 /ASSEMBLY_ACC=CAM_ASM_000208 /TAXON_ID=96639 /ORGANISM=" , Strain NY0313808BC1" /LENGTH=413 /DNA_ID=CAMNT_0050657641 /DNA_START=288 /DNA_END=1529 /DNA_ORIENTATION=-
MQRVVARCAPVCLSSSRAIGKLSARKVVHSQVMFGRQFGGVREFSSSSDETLKKNKMGIDEEAERRFLAKFDSRDPNESFGKDDGDFSPDDVWDESHENIDEWGCERREEENLDVSRIEPEQVDGFKGKQFPKLKHIYPKKKPKRNSKQRRVEREKLEIAKERPKPIHETVPLKKYLQQHIGISSREAINYINRGFVMVDGKVPPEDGGIFTPVSHDTDITILPELYEAENSKLTFVLNKPVGFVSFQPEGEQIPAIRLLDDTRRCYLHKELLNNAPPREYTKRLAPCGRLDQDSHGLLILSQSGAIAKLLVGSDIEKEYYVEVKETLSHRQILQLRSGLELDGELLKDAKVDRMSKNMFRMILTQGKKRQIRRMCGLVGLTVVDLQRVRIGTLRLDIPVGKWRPLLPEERFV